MECFAAEKNKVQIILITSKTNYFEAFEEKFYIEESHKLRSKSQFLNSITLKILKKSEIKNLSSEEENKLKEYDNFKNSIKILIKNNFPYISFAFGGFYNIHNNAIKLKIPLMNHENCTLCKVVKKKESLIDKLITWTSQKFSYHEAFSKSISAREIKREVQKVFTTVILVVI